MAKIEVIFHPEASEEYVAAYAWYHERGPHLAEAFERETERAVLLIAESPQRWPVYRKKYRWFLLRRFPFSLIYKIQEDKIVVIAVGHTKRRPGYWKNRNFIRT
jgi:toxin ParE1/3/4